MPISQGSVAVAPAGSQLKAWVLFTATAGGAVIVKSSGVSSVVRTAVGIYTINFAAAMGGLAYMVQGLFSDASLQPNTYVSQGSKTVNQCSVTAQWFGAALDPSGGLYLAFYE